MDIRNRCPLLEYLKLSTRCSECGWNETQSYKALGTFPSLVKLSLKLGSSEPIDSTLATANEIDTIDPLYKQLFSHDTIPPLYNAYLRNAIINSPMNESFAR